MDPVAHRRIGHTTLEVTQLGFGGAPLGDPDEIIEEARADVTLAAAFEAGIGFYDTAPWYGNTKSEHRFGHYLRGQDRTRFRLSTKVGRVYARPQEPDAFAHSAWAKRWPGGLSFDLRFDYTRAGITRSYEDSLMRLGINTVDALVIHDLDPGHRLGGEGVQQGLRELDEGGGFAVLESLKRHGAIRAIGAGINQVGMIPRFLEHFDIDYFLVAMPYTLLDQPALDAELPLCAQRAVSIVIGAVFASGILATGAEGDGLYGYQTAPTPVREKVAHLSQVCRRHDVPLAAAALQFPLGHPQVTAVIPGAISPTQVRANVEHMRRDIPTDLWAELKNEGLLREDAPTPP